MLATIPFPDISPEIFAIDIFGFHLALRWYAMGYIVGIAIGWQIIAATLRRPTLWRDGAAPMQPSQLEDLLTYIVIGGIGGGRLGYVLIYQPAYYLQNPIEIPQIWNGGMSFHGGFVGVFLMCWLFSHRHKVSLGSLADLICFSVTVPIFLVRIANFINAELWGRASDVSWAVVFPGEAAQACDQLAGVCARHPSQLYEAALEGVLMGLILWTMVRRGALKFPWMVSGVFFAGYGVARFLVEFVRQPDAQFVGPDNPLGWRFDFGEWGLTMGQSLSLPMVLAGVAVILWARKRA